ncbi:hypothetical protein DGWBC_1551 [Dehalogenimonas sp. WBC-2]|nr:hypothetical protein DGWBC_1551 [Dehalogenimonas sp. WBC-2]
MNPAKAKRSYRIKRPVKLLHSRLNAAFILDISGTDRL